MVTALNTVQSTDIHSLQCEKQIIFQVSRTNVTPKAPPGVTEISNAKIPQDTKSTGMCYVLSPSREMPCRLVTGGKGRAVKKQSILWLGGSGAASSKEMCF